MTLHGTFITISDGRRPAEPVAASMSIGLLMLRWQQTGCRHGFTTLVEAVLPEVAEVAKRVLQRRGIQDPDALDDAVSLVLDHLRRLRDDGRGSRRLTEFSPGRPGRPSRDAIDPGLGFVRQLAKARAIDVARGRRRLARKRRVFSDIRGAAEMPTDTIASDDAGSELAQLPLGDRLREAARRLEPRQRLLVEMLLEGKSQAVIAHVLEVSEGTVSRLRTRAIDRLRRILDS